MRPFQLCRADSCSASLSRQREAARWDSTPYRADLEAALDDGSEAEDEPEEEEEEHEHAGTFGFLLALDYTLISAGTAPGDTTQTLRGGFDGERLCARRGPALVPQSSP